MQKFIVGLLIIASITPAFAYYTNTNGFKSNLRMNRPKTQIVDYTTTRPYYRPPRHPHTYYPPQNIRQKRSLMRRISNYFQGHPTGFTPQIDTTTLSQDLTPMVIPGLTPYGGMNTYYPSGGFNNNNFEQYSNGIFGGGWGIHNENFSSGSGVTILP